MQTRDDAVKKLEESKKTGEAQWTAAQKQYQKATPANQKASKKTWDLAQKARDEVRLREFNSLSLYCWLDEPAFHSFSDIHCTAWQFVLSRIGLMAAVLSLDFMRC